MFATNVDCVFGSIVDVAHGDGVWILHLVCLFFLFYV